MVNSEMGESFPWEAWPTARALCVPMHIRDIIGFKAGMSNGKMINYKWRGIRRGYQFEINWGAT
jgi:hypothetical protein